jgi:hypothetical protein
MDDDEEGCEVDEAFLKFMVEVAREAPPGTDPLPGPTASGTASARIRAGPSSRITSPLSTPS